MKATVKSFKGFGILVTQAKVSLQATGLASQLFKTKDLCECLVKLMKTMESAKYTIKEVTQAFQELDYGEDTCSINRYTQKECKAVAFLK